MQPFGDRSDVVIEPMLTDQWYVNAGELAKDAIAAVEDGRTKFVPENWAKTYYPMDAQHRAVVRLAPALVGPPHSGLVWADGATVEGSETAKASSSKLLQVRSRAEAVAEAVGGEALGEPGQSRRDYQRNGLTIKV